MNVENNENISIAVRKQLTEKPPKWLNDFLSLQSYTDMPT